MSTKGEAVNLSTLASFWGVHANTVRAWVRRGCPYETKADRNRGIEWQFNTAEVAEWRLAEVVQDSAGDTGSATKDELERRKLAAETTIAELKAAEKRAELGSVEEFGRQFAGAIVEIRQRLLQIPARVATVLIGVDKESETKAILEDEIAQALNAVANDHGDE